MAVLAATQNRNRLEAVFRCANFQIASELPSRIQVLRVSAFSLTAPSCQTPITLAPRVSSMIGIGRRIPAKVCPKILHCRPIPQAGQEE